MSEIKWPEKRGCDCGIRKMNPYGCDCGYEIWNEAVDACKSAAEKSGGLVPISLDKLNALKESIWEGELTRADELIIDNYNSILAQRFGTNPAEVNELIDLLQEGFNHMLKEYGPADNDVDYGEGNPYTWIKKVEQALAKKGKK